MFLVSSELATLGKAVTSAEDCAAIVTSSQVAPDAAPTAPVPVGGLTHTVAVLDPDYEA
jgi:hypothetical protein